MKQEQTSLTKEMFRKEVIRLREENRELMFKLADQKQKINLLFLKHFGICEHKLAILKVGCKVCGFRKEFEEL